MKPRQYFKRETIILKANFDAFKFAGSSIVQFRALVTPCVPRSVKKNKGIWSSQKVWLLSSRLNEVHTEATLFNLFMFLGVNLFNVIKTQEFEEVLMSLMSLRKWSEKWNIKAEMALKIWLMLVPYFWHRVKYLLFNVVFNHLMLWKAFTKLNLRMILQ